VSALIAAVTDLRGHLTGVHRTWLDPSGFGKAPIATPRRAMGHLLGHAVRFPPSPAFAGFGGRVDIADDVLAAGEGIETMLSLHCALPLLPMTAALSANHLAAMLLPATLRVLYIVRDADTAGDGAVATLSERARGDGIAARTLSPLLEDFNDDLRTLGLAALRDSLRGQLAPEHVARFLDPARTK